MIAEHQEKREEKQKSTETTPINQSKIAAG
jgi:hypothetical protein